MAKTDKWCHPTDAFHFSPLMLSIVIPAKDEARSLAGVIDRVKETLSRYPHEILVVDDGSEDATCEVARHSGASVVSHGKNLGKGAAMKTGIEHTRGNVVVFIDADGAHDAGDVPAVVAPIVCEGASFVIGSRCLPQSQVAVSPFVRKLGNRFASLAITGIISLLLPVASLFRCPPRHIRITDCTSGFRAIRRDAWHRLELVSKGFQIEAEMIYEAVRAGLTIAEAPISCNWNPQFSHLSIFGDGATTAVLLAWKLLREVPGRRGSSPTRRSEPAALFGRHARQETD